MSDTTRGDDNTNSQPDAPVTPAESQESSAGPESSETRDAARTPAEPEGFTGTGSHAALPGDYAPTPVAAEGVKRETYVPSAAGDYAGTPGGTGATSYEGDYTPREAYPASSTEYPTAQPAPQTPIYVQAPAPPRDRSNRGGGLLIALLASVIMAALYALAALIFLGLGTRDVTDAATLFTDFAAKYVFYVPVIFFFLAFALVIGLVNRGGWWAYVLLGFFVAVVVYFSYIGGALLTAEAWNLTPTEAWHFVGNQWLSPYGVAAAVIAREVTIWAGAWIARRGRRLTARNVEARDEYDDLIAEGPQISRNA